MRKAHYWKHASATNLPSLVCVVDTETVPDPNYPSPSEELHRLAFGYALSYRLEKGKRTRSSSTWIDKVQDWWAFLDSRLDKDRTLWVVGHNLPYDLGILGAWTRFMTDDWQWDRIIIEGGIFLMEGIRQGKRVCLCDTFNWYKCSLATIGASVGLPKLDMPTIDPRSSEARNYCKRDVEITAKGFDTLVEYVRTTGAGPFGPTIASLAFNTYRKLFMPYKVLVSDNTDALTIERNAYYGGIVATNYIGECPASPVYELDVVSMYPAVCLNPLPATFVKHLSIREPADALRMLKHWYGYARVLIDCPSDPYPLREEDRVLYPVGRYWTYLPHPELRRALELGHVAAVDGMTTHDAHPIFAGFMNYYANAKAAHKAEGHDAFATVDKFIMNSLYGKTGQLTPRYAPLKEDSLREWCELHKVPYEYAWAAVKDITSLPYFEHTIGLPEYGTAIPLRDYFGYLELEMGRSESRDSVPAIAATVTSFARLKLRTYQGICAPKHWFYSDTDSIWVDRLGYEKLWRHGMVKPGVLGCLTPSRRVKRLTVHGRKDYECEGVDVFKQGKWVPDRERVRKLKGIRPNAEAIDSSTYRQPHFPGVIPQVKAGLADAVLIEYAIKHLRRVIDWCTVGPDGWTQPLTRG